jgi:hypothetical protein
MLKIRTALAGLFRHKIFLLAGLIGASYLFSFQTVSALAPSPGKIPNGAKYDCLTCHTSGSYAADTQMKLDFLHATPTKTWTIALAQTDSDGDGFTNGEELQDPTGAWVIGDANPGSVTDVSNPSVIGSQPPAPQFTFSGVSGGTTLTGKVSIGVNISAANPTDVTKVEFALLAFGGQVVYSATDTSAPFCLVPDCTPWDSASVPSGVYTIQAISYDKRSAAAGGPRTTYRAAGIYIDNPDPVSVEFSAANYAVSEGAAKATTTVELSGPASQPVTVAYTTGGGSATPGSDYAPASGTLTFDPGQTSKTFEITIVDDAIAEPAETLDLTLSDPSNAALGGRDTATLTIGDNDQNTISISASDASAAEAGLDAGAFSIARSGGLGAAVTVYYSVSGSASKGSDYTALASSVTIPVGAASASIALTPHDDAAVEGAETVTLKLKADATYAIGTPNSATVTIADDDSNTQTISIASSGPDAAEADPTGSTLTLTRSGNPASALTVSYSIAGSATPGVDFSALPGSITIPAGQSSATLTITPLDDAVVEGDETVIVTLLSHAAYLIEEPSSASVLIADDDSQPVPGPQPAPERTIYLPAIVR